MSVLNRYSRKKPISTLQERANSRPGLPAVNQGPVGPGGYAQMRERFNSIPGANTIGGPSSAGPPVPGLPGATYDVLRRGPGQQASSPTPFTAEPLATVGTSPGTSVFQPQGGQSMFSVRDNIPGGGAQHPKRREDIEERAPYHPYGPLLPKITYPNRGLGARNYVEPGGYSSTPDYVGGTEDVDSSILPFPSLTDALREQGHPLYAAPKRGGTPPAPSAYEMPNANVWDRPPAPVALPDVYRPGQHAPKPTLLGGRRQPQTLPNGLTQPQESALQRQYKQRSGQIQADINSGSRIDAIRRQQSAGNIQQIQSAPPMGGFSAQQVPVESRLRGVPADTPEAIQGRKSAFGTPYPTSLQRAPAVDETEMRRKWLHGEGDESDYQGYNFGGAALGQAQTPYFGMYAPNNASRDNGGRIRRPPQGFVGRDGSYGIAGGNYSVDQGGQGVDDQGRLAGPVGRQDGSPMQVPLLKQDVRVLQGRSQNTETVPDDVGSLMEMRARLYGVNRGLADTANAETEARRAENRHGYLAARTADRYAKAGRHVESGIMAHRAAGWQKKADQRAGLIPPDGAGGSSYSPSAPLPANASLADKVRAREDAAKKSDEFIKANPILGDNGLGFGSDPAPEDINYTLKNRAGDMQEPDFQTVQEYLRLRATDPEFVKPGSLADVILKAPRGRIREFVQKHLQNQQDTYTPDTSWGGGF